MVSQWFEVNAREVVHLALFPMKSWGPELNTQNPSEILRTRRPFMIPALEVEIATLGSSR